MSIDAIEEFKVLTSQYAAEYGKAGGAQINLVTRSGKRTFSGTGCLFLRDDRLDGDDFQTARKALLDFRTFGRTLGGPIAWKGFTERRSKLFFFAAQEWKQLDSQVGLTRTATTPRLLERQGNYSQSPRVPIDPQTGKPFPGGVIPADRPSPSGLALASRFPRPDAGSRTIATLTPTQSRDIHETIVRLDARPGPAVTLTGRDIRDRVEQIEPFGSFGGSSAYAQVPTAHDRFSDSVLLSCSHVVGTRLFHDLSLSLVRNDQDLNQSGDLYGRTGIDVPGLFPLNRNDRAPNITSLTGYSLGTGLFGRQYPTHIVGNYDTIKDNITFARGAHSFNAGVSLGHFRKNEELRTPDAGSFTFTDTQTGGPAWRSRICSSAGTTRTPRPTSRRTGYNQIEMYVQDHRQVRENVTLDYGVRYQYMPAMYERANRIATFDPALYDPALAPQLRAGGSIVPGTGLVRRSDAPAVRVDAGITRQILRHDPCLMMVRAPFAAAAVGTLHAHPHRQVTYVERGTFDATVDGATVRGGGRAIVSWLRPGPVTASSRSKKARSSTCSLRRGWIT